MNDPDRRNRRSDVRAARDLTERQRDRRLQDLADPLRLDAADLAGGAAQLARVRGGVQPVLAQQPAANSGLTGLGGIGTIEATVNRLANRLVPSQTAAVVGLAQTVAVSGQARRRPVGSR